MATTTTCPECSRQLRVPDELFGRLVKCPSCGHTFTASEDVVAEAMPLPTASPAPAPRSEPKGYEVVGEERLPASDDADYGEPRPRRRRDVVRRDLEPHRGALILTFGILSLVICGFFGPFAWVMGNNDLAQMRMGRMDREGEGLTQAGRICGMISSILMIVVCLFYCVVFGVMGIGGHRGFR